MPDSLSASVEIEVPFFDVDALSVVWHGHYVKYFEVARCKLLDKIGYNYDDMKLSGYAFPVIDLQIRYAKPIRFRQKLLVTAKLVEWEHRLVMSYQVVDVETNNPLTRGKTVQVAVSMPDQVTQFICPPVFVDKVESLLASSE